MFRRRQLPVIVAAAILAALLLHGSEEDRILAQLEELRALAEIHAPEGNIEVLVKSRQLGDYFTENTFFDLSSNGGRLYEIPSRQELVQQVAGIRARLASLELAIEDAQVSIEAGTARVRLLGTGLGSIRGGDGRFMEVHTVEILLRQQDDTWLVTGGRHIRNERDPAG